MTPPWWHAELDHLSQAPLATRSLGELWHLSERLLLLRENVGPAVVDDGSAEGWSAFERFESDLGRELGAATARETARVRTGGHDKASFRAHWEGLGFAPNARGAGTPADDYLDALMHTSRFDFLAPGSSLASVGLGSRASRVSDVLQVVDASMDDVVFDLGSGSGKFALTVAASAATRVRGVEFLAGPVERARGSAASLGLSNVVFDHADVRDVDLGEGSIFYLYFPFRGDVASTVAATLGALAREKDVVVYFSGPERGFAEYFRREVAGGALREVERRGEFGEVSVLASERR